MLPNENNRVRRAEEKDQFGLPIARVTFSYSDNDKKRIDHSIRFMRQSLDAAGVRDLWVILVISTVRHAWGPIRAAAWSMPTAAVGIFRTHGFAMDRSFPRSVASNRL